MSEDPGETELDILLAQMAGEENSAPPALRARVLADFDAVIARRRNSFVARLARALWPDVPLWQPAMALTAALAIGIIAGLAVPADAMTQPRDTAFAFDAPNLWDKGEDS